MLWSVLSACVDICLRWMGKTENSNATVFYFTLLGTLITALHWPFAKIEAHSFSPDAFFIIAGLGLSGVLDVATLLRTEKL